MNVPISRLVSLLLVSLFLLPLIAGCGKSEKSMEAPGGLSNREKRDMKANPGP